LAKPTPGAIRLDHLLNPASNPTFKLYLMTSVALVLKTHFMAWAQVVVACANNSFSKNPWDVATGNPKKMAIRTEDDLRKTTLHNIHGNDLENIPLTLLLHTMLVLVQPAEPTAKFIMLTYTISRFVHSFWYMFYGSHEIRATLWSVNCFCNYAAVCQILAACDVL
jgi:uncharacterized membrane protein YecN with MAPEG domain